MNRTDLAYGILVTLMFPPLGLVWWLAYLNDYPDWTWEIGCNDPRLTQKEQEETLRS